MKRWTFHITAALSLLLMLATVGLWVDSWSHVTVILWQERGGSKAVGVASWLNSVEFSISLLSPPIRLQKDEASWSITRESLASGPGYYPVGNSWERDYKWGFRYTDVMMFGTLRAIDIGVPHWLPVLLFSILPTIWFVRWRRRRHLPDNPCTSCGYDLTGNTTGNCSECGEATH